MPRSHILLTSRPVDGDTIAQAAGTVWAAADGLDADADAFELRALDGGAALQVLAAGEPVLTVLRPRLLPDTAEVARLLPEAPAGVDAGWWTDAYTPWHPGGEIGAAILRASVEACDGVVVDQGLTPAPRSQR